MAPLVDFNLTSGQLKAIYWRYDACPREDVHVDNGVCEGWCVVDWYRLFSGNLGQPKYISSSTLRVPYGVGELPDKRRGGRWYLGIQALDGPATYTLTTGFDTPSTETMTGCNRLDHYCLTDPRADRYKDLFQSKAPCSARGRKARSSRAARVNAALTGAASACALYRIWRAAR